LSERSKVSFDNPQQSPTKRALPMSQKSDVVYSKPTLESEARKYKSAEEFVKAKI